MRSQVMEVVKVGNPSSRDSSARDECFSHYLLHDIDVVSITNFLIFRAVRLQILRHRVHAVEKGIESPVVAETLLLR